jgi:arginase
MRIQLIQVPYDAGHRSVRMGRGPERIVNGGVGETLRGNGHTVHTDLVEAPSAFRTEIKTAFELHKRVAARVQAATQQACFPLVLSGNCNVSVGTLAGLDPRELGIVWFDGHADFNTPETTTSGSLDGMGLAIATGGCWKTMTQSIPGFRPVPEAHAVLVGSRDIEPEERERLRRPEVTLVEVEPLRKRGVRGALGNALDALHGRVSRVYVHLDLDVLDPEGAPANEFAPPNGLRHEELEEGIREIQDRFTLAAAGVASYDPDYGNKDRILHAGVRLIELLTEHPSDEVRSDLKVRRPFSSSQDVGAG